MARQGKVAVIGAGFYGSTTAQRLAEYDVFDEVVLTDIIEGRPEGLALDMNQSRPIEGFETRVTGQTTTPDGQGYEALGVYLGVEAEIGRAGVRRVVERDLTKAELAGLRTAAEAVRAKQADVASL